MVDTSQGDGDAARFVPVSAIVPNPYQPRRIFNEAALQELVASVLEHGVLQPVLVRRTDAGYELVSGERRLTAARRAGLERIPAIVKDYDNRQMLEIAIVENIQREDISAMEAAEAYKRLMDEFHLTHEQVALRLGKSRPAVSNTLRLLKLPENIRKSLMRGEISEGHARSLVSIADPEWQQRVWRRIVEDNLSVRDAETLIYGPTEASPPSLDHAEDVSRETSSPRRGGHGNADPNLSAVEQRLRLLMGTRVRIRGSVRSGTIGIDYFSEDDLERLVALLGLV